MYEVRGRGLVAMHGYQPPPPHLIHTAWHKWVQGAERAGACTANSALVRWKMISQVSTRPGYLGQAKFSPPFFISLRKYIFPPLLPPRHRQGPTRLTNPITRGAIIIIAQSTIVPVQWLFIVTGYY